MTTEKTVFVHIGDRIVPFSTSMIKLVRREETKLPSAEPQRAPTVRGDINSEEEQLHSKYGNLPEPILRQE